MIAISSFSLRELLGPVRIEYRGEGGGLEEFRLPYPATLSIPGFLDGVAGLGVAAVELCQIQLDEGSDWDGLRRALDERGMVLQTMPVDVGDLAEADEGRRREDLARVLAWFDVAARLGARHVRVNAGSPFAGRAPDLGARGPLVRSLDELADAAAERGARLLVENHGGASSDPGVLLELRERVGAERLGILLDLGNFEPVLSLTRAELTGEPAPEDPDLAPLYASIAALAPVASLVHAKSYGWEADGMSRHLDLERSLRTAAEAGYHGPVSVEYEGTGGDPWEGTARTLEVVRGVFGVRGAS